MTSEETRRAAFAPFIPPTTEFPARPFLAGFRMPRRGREGFRDLSLDDLPRVVDALLPLASHPHRFTIEEMPPLSGGALAETLVYARRRGLAPVVALLAPPAEEDVRLLLERGVREAEVVTRETGDELLRALLLLAEARLETTVRFRLDGANLTRLGLVLAACADYGVRRLVVSFPVSRDEVGTFSASDAEGVFNFLFGEMAVSDVFLDAEYAPHLRRHILERLMEERRGVARPPLRKLYMPGIRLALEETTALLRQPEWLKNDPAMRVHGLGAGDGILFIDSAGRILPSARYPADAGNIRENDPLEVYRASTLFRDLRARRHLKGKCRGCPYHTLCGGSRERAAALGGDPWLEEPLCAFAFTAKLKR